MKTRAAQSQTSTSPHTAQLFCAVFTPFLPRFYPRITPAVPFLPRFYPVFTPVLPQRCSFYPVFTPFLPQYYPNGAVFTPFLPRFYPPHHLTFTPFLPQFLPRRLPRFYPVFTLFRGVKSRVYPKFTPVPRFLPQQAFYPNFSTYAPFLPQFYPRGKTGLFLLVKSNSLAVAYLVNIKHSHEG